uniref:Uncharacterized protein n=1 Tax=Homalodisca liturata TaxID=320908 RepID=A0A1B6HG94_9HEMI
MRKVTLPELQTCCGFVSLRSGSKLFGFISLIGSLFICLECACAIILFHVHPQFITTAVGALAVELLVHIVHSVTSVFLLLGVYQDKPNLMFWWLITAVLIFVMETFLLPSLLIRALTLHLPFDKDYNMICITLLMMIDDVYGWLVVHSYYRKLTPQGTDVV